MATQLLGASANLNAAGGRPGAAPTVLQGALVVGGGTTVVGNETVNGTLTVVQPQGGGTRTAYFTDGGVGPAENSVAIFNDQANTELVFRDSGNEGAFAFSGTALAAAGSFLLTKSLDVTGQVNSTGNISTLGGLNALSNSVFSSFLRAGGGIVGNTGESGGPPNFPNGLLINGDPLSSGITSSPTAGPNNTWWVKFNAPGSNNSFAIVGGSGQQSEGPTGGMTITGPPFTQVITGVGGLIKGQNNLVQLDIGGCNGPAGEIKFFASNFGGDPQAGATVYGIAFVLCPDA